MDGIIILTAFFIKHFIADFLLQTKYQYSNKGTYGHLGGILHVAIHGISSLPIVYFLSPNFLTLSTSILVVVFEMSVHYHIDWAKMNLNTRMDWKCDKNDEFWTLLGFDQLFHYLTYSIMAVLMIYS